MTTWTYIGILIWVVQWFEIGAINELKVLLHGTRGADEYGVKVECVADVLQESGYYAVCG